MTSSVGSRVYALLSASSALAALVSDRIYPGQAKQGAAAPRVVFLPVSEVPQNSLQGYTSGLTKARVQIDCYARTYEGANDVANAVGAIFDARTTDPASVRLSRRDIYEDEAQLFRASLDYSVWAKEQ